MQKWKTTCVSILWFHNIVNMEEIYHDITFISADTTLQHFFHYHPIAGSLKQVLEQPGKVALSEAFAHKLFGDKIH